MIILLHLFSWNQSSIFRAEAEHSMFSKKANHINIETSTVQVHCKKEFLKSFSSLTAICSYVHYISLHDSKSTELNILNSHETPSSVWKQGLYFRCKRKKAAFFEKKMESNDHSRIFPHLFVSTLFWVAKSTSTTISEGLKYNWCTISSCLDIYNLPTCDVCMLSILEN